MMARGDASENGFCSEKMEIKCMECYRSAIQNIAHMLALSVFYDLCLLCNDQLSCPSLILHHDEIIHLLDCKILLYRQQTRRGLRRWSRRGSLMDWRFHQRIWWSMNMPRRNSDIEFLFRTIAFVFVLKSLPVSRWCRACIIVVLSTQIPKTWTAHHSSSALSRVTNSCAFSNFNRSSQITKLQGHTNRFNKTLFGERFLRRVRKSFQWDRDM